MKMFGLPTGFETTAGKQVDDARCHISGVLTKTTRQVRNRTEVGRRGLPTPPARTPAPPFASLTFGRGDAFAAWAQLAPPRSLSLLPPDAGAPIHEQEGGIQQAAAGGKDGPNRAA